MGCRTSKTTAIEKGAVGVEEAVTPSKKGNLKIPGSKPRNSKAGIASPAGTNRDLKSPEEKARSREDKSTRAATSPVTDAEFAAADGKDEKKKGKKKDRRGSKPKLVRAASHRGMISKLALQFKTIHKSFQLVHDAFDRYRTNTDGKDSLTADELGKVLRSIGEHREFSDDEVKELFSLADLDNSKKIEFKEFLIAIAMGYFLKVNSDNKEFREIQKGFRVVEKAFADMDDDKSGNVDVKELKQALFAASHTSNNELLEQRFKELDFDGNGDIEFPEFLYGIIAWVGFMDDHGEALQDHAPPASTPTPVSP